MPSGYPHLQLCFSPALPFIFHPYFLCFFLFEYVRYAKTYPELAGLSEVVGGTAYGAGTMAGGDGSRQPTVHLFSLSLVPIFLLFPSHSLSVGLASISLSLSFSP